MLLSINAFVGYADRKLALRSYQNDILSEKCFL